MIKSFKSAYLIIALSVLGLAFCVYHAQRFEIDASAETLLTKENKLYQTARESYLRYEPDEFILIAYTPESDDIFSAKTLNTLDEIADKISTLERVKQVRSIVNTPLFTALDSIVGGIEPDELTWKAKKFSLEEMHMRLSSHPLYENLLFDEQKTTVSLQVVFSPNDQLANINQKLQTFDNAKDNKKQIERLTEEKQSIEKTLEQQRSNEIEQIRRITDEYQSSGQFYLGGNNLLAYELISIIRNDLIVFGTAISIIIGILLLILFRSFRWAFLALASCGFSIAITVGVLGFLGLKVTIISANVVALQIILTLAIVIHLIVHYFELSLNSPVAKDAGAIDTAKQQEPENLTARSRHLALMRQTVSEKWRPCLYAALTTTIGFMSLIFSGIQPVISFGWMMAIAMASTLITGLIIFPAIAAVAFKQVVSKKPPDIIERTMSYCADFCLRRQKSVVIVSIMLLIAGVAGSFRLTAENSFINYFKTSTDTYKELSFIDGQFGGSTSLDVLYDIPENQQNPDLVLTAATMQKIGAIHDVLENNEAIGAVTSIADFTRVASTVMGKPLTEYELTILFKSLDESTRSDLIGSYFSQDEQQVRISTRVIDTTENFNRDIFLERLKSDLAGTGISPDNFTLTNLFVLYQDILARLVNSQLKTLGLVYLAMLFVLVAIFRSLKIAIIAMVPNILTTAAIFGGLGLFGIPLDLMSITVAAIAMGISMDDTIHYIDRYRKEIKSSKGNPVKTTHLSVGYALVYTTLVLSIGFSALLFSDFVPSIIFGMLAAMAMIVAVVCDIFLLPILLNRFINGKSTNNKKPAQVVA